MDMGGWGGMGGADMGGWGREMAGAHGSPPGRPPGKSNYPSLGAPAPQPDPPDLDGPGASSANRNGAAFGRPAPKMVVTAFGRRPPILG